MKSAVTGNLPMVVVGPPLNFEIGISLPCGCARLFIHYVHSCPQRLASSSVRKCAVLWRQLTSMADEHGQTYKCCPIFVVLYQKHNPEANSATRSSQNDTFKTAEKGYTIKTKSIETHNMVGCIC
jgi:hypothetical protein